MSEKEPKEMDASEDVEELAGLGQQLVDRILERAPLSDLTMLIDAGAPLWYQTPDEGVSALHAAAYIEDTELVQRLIEQGAVWNAGYCPCAVWPSRRISHAALPTSGHPREHRR
jgi:hypothetical protein